MSEDEPELSPIAVSFRGVSKRYPWGEALHALDLDVREGEFFGFLGPAGSGKTTFVQLLAGFEDPDEGEILLGGNPTQRIPPHQRNLGVILQSLGLFPNMSALENVIYPLRIRGVPRGESRRRAREALERLGMEEGLGRVPAWLSRAQRLRTALARALVFEPAVLVLDDVMRRLSRSAKEHLLIEIGNLHREMELTTVYATDDPLVAIASSDRIAVVRDGRLQQVGTPRELYREPANAFVARFVAEANTLSGTIRGTTEEGLTQVTLDTGETVLARSRQAGSAGTRTALCIRPGQVRLDPPKGEFQNRYRARVEALIYRGDHQHLQVRLPGGGELSVRLGETGAEAALAVDDEVVVAWDGEDCQALAPA